mmetsp:Transcript_15316/g.33096  ORF Transcript_15316/g.33096 Transcript_15316/m.33096 type:complete len:317 (+) Transcript_15316:981-1931(+)
MKGTIPKNRPASRMPSCCRRRFQKAVRNLSLCCAPAESGGWRQSQDLNDSCPESSPVSFDSVTWWKRLTRPAVRVSTMLREAPGRLPAVEMKITGVPIPREGSAEWMREVMTNLALDIKVTCLQDMSNRFRVVHISAFFAICLKLTILCCSSSGTIFATKFGLASTTKMKSSRSTSRPDGLRISCVPQAEKKEGTSGQTCFITSNVWRSRAPIGECSKNTSWVAFFFEILSTKPGPKYIETMMGFNPGPGGHSILVPSYHALRTIVIWLVISLPLGIRHCCGFLYLLSIASRSTKTSMWGRKWVGPKLWVSSPLFP